MSLPVVLRREASKDAADIYAYLQVQRKDLGRSFLKRLHQTLARIGAMPKIYSIIWMNVRAARLRRFAYVVYYRVETHRIEVFAIMHGSRDASDWKSRA